MSQELDSDPSLSALFTDDGTGDGFLASAVPEPPQDPPAVVVKVERADDPPHGDHGVVVQAVNNGTTEAASRQFVPVTQLSVVPVTLPGSRVKRSREEMATTSGNEFDTPQKTGSGGSDDDQPSPKRQGLPQELIDEGKKRAARGGGDKHSKGLRQFSLKVCQKVESKGNTTYNEVADELVAEFTDPRNVYGRRADDEKNIRRRVYDALNVLMAMDIITKEKKAISWRGLPANAEKSVADARAEKAKQQNRIRDKTEHIKELLQQHIALKRVIERNKRAEAEAAASSAPALTASDQRLYLPFIMINTRREAVVECSMSDDKQEVTFDLSMPFEIHDDCEILKRMRMNQCAPEELETLVPGGLHSYLQDSPPATPSHH